MAFSSKSTNKCDHKIKIYPPCYPLPTKSPPQKPNQHCDTITLLQIINAGKPILQILSSLCQTNKKLTYANKKQPHIFVRLIGNSKMGIKHQTARGFD
jgi:hypothetical protein